MLKSIKHSHKNDFQLNLDLSSILVDFDTIENQNMESAQVFINSTFKTFFFNLNIFDFQAHKTVVRYLDLFKQIYRFYSQLGMDISPDNTYMLNRMQFWRFLKDCKVHINEDDLTLMQFDRLLSKILFSLF